VNPMNIAVAQYNAYQAQRAHEQRVAALRKDLNRGDYVFSPPQDKEKLGKHYHPGDPNFPCDGPCHTGADAKKAPVQEQKTLSSSVAAVTPVAAVNPVPAALSVRVPNPVPAPNAIPADGWSLVHSKKKRRNAIVPTQEKKGDASDGEFSEVQIPKDDSDDDYVMVETPWTRRR
jgi:hypothetical protein